MGAALAAYGPLCTLFYDADKPLADDAEVAWYRQYLPTDADPVLEVMCGSGRLLVPLVAQGVKVHGTDASAAMLASCEARLADAGLVAPLFRQDARELNLPFRYAGAFIAAGSFQLFEKPLDAMAVLARIRAHLVDPGILLLDAFVPAESRQRLAAPLVEVRTVKLTDGTRIALRSESTCIAESRLLRYENRYVHRRGTTLLAEEHEKLTLTWYPRDELADIVRAAGFRDVEIKPSPSSVDGDESYVVSARK
ncbi:MAG: class I SAM-dependent methyltransferase [Betaproteobacteria bacterium]